ncbi:MAG: hypothetical protein RR977_01830 [Oscillospiraceae bacterium]
MKMQVLYTEKKEGKRDNPEILAERVSREFKSRGDKIPPAYPCDNERLAIIICENYGEIDKRLVNFSKDLYKQRAANVALIVLSKDGQADIGELKGIFEKNGVAIAGTLGLEVKKGLFSAAKLTEDQFTESVAFARKVVEALFDVID